MSKKGLDAKPVTEKTPLITDKNAGGESGGGGGGGGGSGSESIDKNGSSGGLSMKQAALLVAGEMAGSGVLALPRALVKTGWIGVPLIVLMCAVAAFSGKRLGDCWSIIEDRDPAMRTKKRNPYAIIADQTLGRTWSVVVSMAIIVTLFGASVVYLLLAAQIIGQLLLTLLPTVTICSWYLVVVGGMTPLMFFTTPKDFKWTGVIAFGSSVLACLFYFIEMMNDIRPFVFRWGIHGFQDFFLAFGTILFAFGGASTFPTIQNDMSDKSQFTKSINYSFIAILMLYLPIAVGGYAVYGDAVAPNVSASLAATPLTLVGNVLMAVHLVFAFIILINPVCQEMEELYNVPHDSTGWRMLVRLSIMGGILFIGESIPRFYTILSLVGATSVALLTFILPSSCYLSLVSQTPREGQTPIETPGWMKMLCYEVILVGVIGGIAATWAALTAVFSTSQAKPCYLTNHIMVLSCILRNVTRSTRNGVTTHCCRRVMYSTDHKIRFYTKKHEWVSVNDNIGTVGISSFAQDALGEVVFAQLPEVDAKLAAGDECGALESVKAAGEIYTPVSGTVIEKNSAVESTPSLINKSCYEQGWLFRVKLASPEELQMLMDQATYDKYLEESH